MKKKHEHCNSYQENSSTESDAVSRRGVIKSIISDDQFNLPSEVNYKLGGTPRVFSEGTG